MRFNEFKKISENLDGILNAIMGKAGIDVAAFNKDNSKTDKTDNTTTDKTTTDKPATASTPKDKPATPNAKDKTSNIQDPDFNKKLAKVAAALGIQEEHLRKIIKFETAGTFSPTSRDPWNVSIGLIGFTEQTAKGLGTSKAELANMTAVQQLDYVYKFYKKSGLRPGSDIGTMYMLTFMPAYAYASDSKVLGMKGGGPLDNTGLSMHKVWEQNPSFGKSKGKSYFTVGDVKSHILRR